MDTIKPAKNILVIDDDEHFAQILGRSLKRFGHTATYATNTDDALQKLDSARFDWISLDLRLGQESGLTLLPKLKAINHEQRIVVLTGFASIPTAVEAIKLGAFNFLHKPASVKELLTAFGDSNDQTEIKINEIPMSIERLEWEHIQRVLHEHKGNISSTARALAMHRRTLQRKLQKHPTRT
jgi:two-component system response regulator RegA